MIPSIPMAAVPPPSADAATTQPPQAIRLNAYQQALQHGSPEAQARAHGSPAALAQDAMVLVNRFQAQLRAFGAELQTADRAAAMPVQTADFRPPASAATSAAPATTSAPTGSPQTGSTDASLHLIVETFDFAVQEHLLTQAATQLTGAVNTLVKGQ
jgi:hypothetical protein